MVYVDWKPCEEDHFWPSKRMTLWELRMVPFQSCKSGHVSYPLRDWFPHLENGIDSYSFREESNVLFITLCFTEEAVRVWEVNPPAQGRKQSQASQGQSPVLSRFRDEYFEWLIFSTGKMRSIPQG